MGTAHLLHYPPVGVQAKTKAIQLVSDNFHYLTAPVLGTWYVVLRFDEFEHKLLSAQ